LSEPDPGVRGSPSRTGGLDGEPGSRSGRSEKRAANLHCGLRLGATGSPKACLRVTSGVLDRGDGLIRG
jgi:hypothetical protein